MIDANVDTTPVAIGSLDQDDEALQLARDELLGYLDVLWNSPPATLTNTQEMVDLIKRMLDEANNRHILDFNFTLGLSAFESSLKRKKSFLNPTNKRRRRKRNRVLEIDLNVHPSEYEPFQFESVNKRGRPCSNNTSPIVPGKLDWMRRFICLGFFVYPSSFLTCSVMMIIDVQHSAVDN